MNDPHDYQLDARKTYNYVRLSMVGLVVALGAAVLIERFWNGGCFEGSISAYYYTPVHSVFVGALIAIGVGLIAIKGTRTEDLFLNLAGFMAPIVALVPTSLPDEPDRCSNTPVLLDDDVRSMVSNNSLALLIAGVVVFAIVWKVADRNGDRSTRLLRDRRNLLGFVVSAAVLLLGTYLYFFEEDWFRAHAHGVSAGLMFLFIGVVVFINAKATKRPRFAKAYWVVLGAMVASAIGVLIAGWLFPEWRHAVLVIEVLEIVPFMVFWVLQTAELWNKGSRRVDVAALPKMLT